MRFLSFGLVVGLLFAGPVIGQPVQLRSGEHSDFSRLVFADDLGQTWQIERSTDRVVNIRFTGATPELDIESVFDLIPRDRLESISYQSGTLSLDLACNCAVEITQIPSGHVVIDVLDSPSNDAVRQIAEFRAIPIPLQDISLDLSIPGSAEAPKRRTLEPPLSPSADRPPQVRVQPLRNASLIPSEAESQVAVSTMTCSLEQRAATILSMNPDEALEKIFDQASMLLDGQDRLSSQAIGKLSDLYLSAGWGAEAISVLQAGNVSDLESEVIGAALDATEPPESAIVDPGCGPAATTLALLLGTERDLWARSDQATLVRFLADLPPSRWRDLEAQLTRSLTELSASDILIGLHPRQDEPEQVDETPAIAGTDRTAILSVSRLLEAANADNEPLDEANLVNAMALLTSVPPGPDKQSLRTSLALALLQAGHLAEALDLVKGNPEETEELVGQALARLERGVAVEFAVRARPSLAAASPMRTQTAELIGDFGLPELAGAFAPRLPRPIESRAEPAGLDADPWLARDYSQVADTDDGSPRQTVAQLLFSRDTEAAPAGDLAAAEQILAESQQMSAAIGNLLRNPEAR